MVQDERGSWSAEVRERLERWAAWSRGHQLVRGTKNVLADMIERAAGEVPGADCSSDYRFTFDIEVTDKAIARLKLHSNQAHRTRKRYMKEAKRVLMSTYLGRLGLIEIATRMNVSTDYVRALLWYAESYVGRQVPEIERELRERENGRRVSPV